MSSGLDWERFGVIMGGDEVCILPPPTLSEKGVGIRTFVHFPFILVFSFLERKIPFAGVELTSQHVRGLRGTSELPGRPIQVFKRVPQR